MFAEITAQHPGVELVAMCDPDPRTRERVAAERQIPGFADVSAMLASSPELDAAIIASPDHLHRAASLACLDRGLDLLVEKPLTTVGAEATDIMVAAQRNGCHVTVGFENRWNPRFTLVRDELTTGSHGRIVNQVACLNDTIFVPTGMLSWAAQSSPAWFLMPHSLDMAMWLAGTVPVTVFARGVKTVLPDRGVDTWDAITATFGMADGSMVTLCSSWILSESAPSVFDFRFQIQTERSTFDVDISSTGVTCMDRDGARWLSPGLHRHRGMLHGIAVDMANDWLDSLCGEDVDLPDAGHGATVTAAIEAVHHSLSAGAPVNLPTPDVSNSELIT